MKYSIIIPVFNKAHFTRQCLDTLRPTLEGAGDGEVIVVDNASSDDTPELLRNYPWIHLIRNEVNLGFAGANNQGAQAALGEFLVLLNNDTKAQNGWLAAMLRVAQEPDVGAVGAKLLFADGSVQHGGVVIFGNPLSRTSLNPFHHNYRVPSTEPDVNRRRDFQAVTGACLATPRALYERLGGLDERYWNGYEDVDYCFKVREQGLQVVYEPAATLFHFESQSGVQRFRKQFWNIERLEERWRGKVAFDAPEANLSRGYIRRTFREARGIVNTHIIAIPPTTVIVHGGEPPVGRASFEANLRDVTTPIANIVWSIEGDTIGLAREIMELRGSRYLAFINGAAILEPGWLDALVGQVESTVDCAAATFAPELSVGENVVPLAADARCTLLSLRLFPRHVRLGKFDTLDGAVADLLLHSIELERGTRGVSRRIAELPPQVADASFEAATGFSLADVYTTDCGAIETRLAARKRKPRGLVSIVTLSWNAVEFTKLALDSIAQYTSEPYEVIVVDNGSRQPTLDYLQSITNPHVRIIYNAKNYGYGGGNNIGMAASRGDHIVLLNNDVIVTEGWLDGLLAPFDRMPSLGVTAPRSNRVAGSQVVVDAKYDGLEGIAEYARVRRETWTRCGYVTERAIGLCLCIDRRVIEEIGGFDEQFGLGNFEDDDLCIRIRAAGYGIYVADDVFIHHFGSRSFAANNVDWNATMAVNWKRFAAKWGYTAPTAENGYEPRTASLAGFMRALHYVPLPGAAPPSETPRPTGEIAVPHLRFYATVRDEKAWVAVAEFVNRFVRTYGCGDAVALSIATFGQPVAETIAGRIERLLSKLSIEPESVPDIEISDEDDAEGWAAGLEADRLIEIATLKDRSPSSLRRLLETSLA